MCYDVRINKWPFHFSFSCPHIINRLWICCKPFTLYESRLCHWMFFEIIPKRYIETHPCFNFSINPRLKYSDTSLNRVNILFSGKYFIPLHISWIIGYNFPEWHKWQLHRPYFILSDCMRFQLYTSPVNSHVIAVVYSSKSSYFGSHLIAIANLSMKVVRSVVLNVISVCVMDR